jgi:hypothetical protein
MDLLCQVRVCSLHTPTAPCAHPQLGSSKERFAGVLQHTYPDLKLLGKQCGTHFSGDLVSVGVLMLPGVLSASAVCAPLQGEHCGSDPADILRQRTVVAFAER